MSSGVIITTIICVTVISLAGIFASLLKSGMNNNIDKK